MITIRDNPNVLKKHYIKTSDGLEIAYYLAEGGEQTIMLIHGFASNAHVNWVFTGWVEFFLKQGFSVLALDNRGHGESQKVYSEHAYHPIRMALDGVEVLHHRNVKKAHIFGYSMGARIATFMAVNYAHIIDKIILGGLAYNMIKGLPHTQEIYDVLMEDNEDSISHYSRDIINYRLFASKYGADLKALAYSLLGSRAVLSTADVSRVTHEALIVVGEDDAVAGEVQPFCALMTNARYVILPKRDHMKAITDKIFYQEVIQFLSDG